MESGYSIKVPSHKKWEEELETHEGGPRKLSETNCIDSAPSIPASRFATEGMESKVAIHDILSSVGNIELRNGTSDRVLLLWRYARARAETWR
jgi:hypothetical protein